MTLLHINGLVSKHGIAKLHIFFVKSHGSRLCFFLTCILFPFTFLFHYLINCLNLCTLPACHHFIDIILVLVVYDACWSV